MEHKHAHKEQQSYYDTRVSELNDMYNAKINELNASNQMSKQAEIDMLRLEFEETMKEQLQVLHSSHREELAAKTINHNAEIEVLTQQNQGLESKIQSLTAETVTLIADNKRLHAERDQQQASIHEQAIEIKRLQEMLAQVASPTSTNTTEIVKYKLSPSEISEIRDGFAAIDRDNDGKIDRNELKEMLLKVLDAKATDQEVEEMIGLVDSNHDGGIDLEEWITATM